jgi:hypothetical protein
MTFKELPFSTPLEALNDALGAVVGAHPTDGEEKETGWRLSHDLRRPLGSMRKTCCRAARNERYWRKKPS